MLGLFDRQWNSPRQDFRHQASVPGVEMLNHHEAGGKILWQSR
jgi:hypothetical protein